METGTIIMAMVGFISIFHGASFLEKVIVKNKSMTNIKANQKRGDWYCFFKLSSLYGNEKEQVGVTEILQKKNNVSIRREQQRRIQANRPRVRV